MLDFRPSFADICVEQGLFAWLLRRGTQRGALDANKMFASELLSLLLQSTELARKRLTEKVDGFDLLLRVGFITLQFQEYCESKKSDYKMYLIDDKVSISILGLTRNLDSFNVI